MSLAVFSQSNIVLLLFKNTLLLQHCTLMLKVEHRNTGNKHKQQREKCINLKGEIGLTETEFPITEQKTMVVDI